jgi:TonB family protein
MLKSAILAILVLVAPPSTIPLLAQSNDSSQATRSSAGRTWSISELDTLSGHKWIWRDPSFKEVVLQTPDSLPDELPYLKKNVASEYPTHARERRVEADVEVRVLIDKKGKVRAAYIQMDSGYEGMGFEEAALRVARGSRWEPAYLQDEPMALWATYKSRFRLTTTSTGDSVARFSRQNWPLAGSESDTGYTRSSDTSRAGTSREDTQPHIEKSPIVQKWGALIYPKAAEYAGIEDSVQVKVLVDRTGRVRDVNVITPSGCPECGFEESALKAAFDTRWKPAEKDGAPTSVWVVYEIRFLLRR